MSRTRHTDKEKARILQEFEHHDGSAASFYSQLGVSYRTVINWRGYVSANLPDPKQPPAFGYWQKDSKKAASADHAPSPAMSSKSH